jgi:hypothetical protein
MDGQFIDVWRETWQGIWTPLTDREDVPDDIFCELYRELARVLKEPVAEGATALVINDAVQRREMFDRALQLAGTKIDRATRDEILNKVLQETVSGLSPSVGSLEAALDEVISDASISRRALGQALSALVNDPKKRAEALERANDIIINDKSKSVDAFEKVEASSIASEAALVGFLETAYAIAGDYGGNSLASAYVGLLTDFIEKYSLRYDICLPCMLCPTLPGIFTSLFRDACRLGSVNGNIAERFEDFQEAVHGLRLGQTKGRIATCISKQVMLLEAIGAATNNVKGTELRAISDQMRQWPHPAVKLSLQNLYGFTSDFPGVRHGTPSTGMLRDLDMRDLVAMSILLTGFTPYFSDQINPDSVYRRG